MEELTGAAVLPGRSLARLCEHRTDMPNLAAWENVCGGLDRRGVEARRVGGAGKGRGTREEEAAPRPLSCEEANGPLSPSHRVFSDGHSSGEAHIGLATGTEN